MAANDPVPNLGGYATKRYALSLFSAVPVENVTGLDAAIAGKADLESPAFTGTPTAPTAAAGTNTTQIASTAFVRGEVSALVNAAPSTLDTLGEIATQLASDESAATALTTTVAGKLAKASNLSDLADPSAARANLGLGTIALLSTAALAARAPGYVGVLSSAGTATAYAPAANTDVARGTALAAAVAAATSGSVVYVGTGTFDLGSGVLNVPDGVSLVGSGRDATVIKSTARADTGGAIVKPGDGGYYARFTVVADGTGDGSTFVYRTPFGWNAVTPVLQTIPLSFTAEDIRLVGQADGIFMSCASSPPATVATFRRTRVETQWDAVNAKRTGINQPWAAVFDYVDCEFVVAGPNADTTHTYRGVSAYAGTHRLTNCVISVDSNDASDQFVQGVAANSVSAFELRGVSIRTAAQSATAADVYAGALATVRVYGGCSYDPSKVSGSPTYATPATFGLPLTTTGSITSTAASTASGSIAFTRDTANDFAASGKRLYQWKNLSANVLGLVHNGANWGLAANGNLDLYTSDTLTDNSGTLKIRSARSVFSGTVEGDGSRLTGVRQTAFNPNRYYGPGPSGGASAYNTGTMWFIPVYVPPGTTVTKMGVNVTVAASAGTTARLVLYASAAGVPTTPVLDGGTVTIDATGIREVTTSYVANGGDYFVAVSIGGTATLSVSNDINRMVGGRAPTTTNFLISQAYTHGAALPNPASATDANGANPLAWVRGS